jgi:hypothetical protein
MKPGDWVRVRPNGGNQHHVGAMIVAVHGTKMQIRSILHGRQEVVNVVNCRLWKSRNVQRKRLLN